MVFPNKLLNENNYERGKTPSGIKLKFSRRDLQVLVLFL